jgi:hypothetical protein
VQRWEGDYKWTGGRVDKWERKRQEAVEKCKGAKVERKNKGTSGLVGGENRENKGTSGRVDWWARK